MSTGNVVAWIERRSDNEYEGAFVAEGVDRRPATAVYTTLDCARRWIEREAAAIAAPVRWLEAVPSWRH